MVPSTDGWYFQSTLSLKPSSNPIRQFLLGLLWAVSNRILLQPFQVTWSSGLRPHITT